MERPLCPLCKTKHYAREGHVFEESSPQVPSQGDETGRKKGQVAKTVDTPAGFDRVAYQREYMREYRARKAFRA